MAAVDQSRLVLFPQSELSFSNEGKKPFCVLPTQVLQLQLQPKVTIWDQEGKTAIFSDTVPPPNLPWQNAANIAGWGIRRTSKWSLQSTESHQLKMSDKDIFSQHQLALSLTYTQTHTCMCTNTHSRKPYQSVLPKSNLHFPPQNFHFYISLIHSTFCL